LHLEDKIDQVKISTTPGDPTESLLRRHAGLLGLAIWVHEAAAVRTRTMGARSSASDSR
jgi:hypothetical protein